VPLGVPGRELQALERRHLPEERMDQAHDIQPLQLARLCTLLESLSDDELQRSVARQLNDAWRA
jgi:hypothetical protein